MGIEIRYEENELILPEISCDCGLNHGIPDIDIYIGQGLIEKVPAYLGQRKLGSKLVLVTDNIIYEVAAKQVLTVLENAGYHVNLCLLERDRPLIPNETALGEILLTLDNSTEFLLAVGSGSITDLTRYAAHVSGKPFAAIGTAASMDGYTSVVAPLTFGNLKVNKPAGFPKVLICDLEIMSQAPYHMFLSGFGDVIGKYMAKADWLLGSIINQEVVCPACIDIVSQAVEKCVDNVEQIKARSLEGTRALIEGLILSGLTILIIGHTRPVASNEHSMAHYWEMMQLQTGEEPPQHGLSVGVATVYCLQFYERFFGLDPHSFRLEEAKAAYLTPEEQARLVLDKFGAKIGSAIIRDNDQIGIGWPEVEKRFHTLKANHSRIRQQLAFLPKARQILDIYREIGYPWPAKAIGIDDRLLLNSLLYAKEYRNRYTVFKSAHELGVLDKLVSQVLQDLSHS
ncbi:MAG: sn-glycerol-1-phosphate dehydrogenase [Limnochordia bacterium]